MTPKLVHVVGGGTISPVRAHLALCAPAYGTTARKIAKLARAQSDSMDVILHLTKMADHESRIETNADLKALALGLVDDPRTKIVFWNPAAVDFDGCIGCLKSGKHAERLRTASGEKVSIDLAPSEKVLDLIRQGGEGRAARKDIFLVSFKTTAGATAEEQYRAGLDLLKRSSSNLVLANDIVTRLNMVIVPEEASYHVTTDRNEALRGLVEMAYLRSHLTFTRSTVVAGDHIAWESDLVPASLRAIVDHCIERGAYKRVRGVTAGHFAVKIDDTTFLTSRRKTDFNDMKSVGLVKVKTDGPDSVIAYGSKPSVGGQSQRIVFSEHPDADCIVHFHCPKKPGSPVPTVSQREYECGSHECGQNTSRGLARFGNLLAVYLDDHGPNIVFNRNTDPAEIIQFIEENFDLEGKTGGFSVA
ncbi:MAG TPA: class II aldolase/adducin family protein [Candidatus Paceibacterota bacterium]|nr:class II aldolase/adducin family protein [Candidatus Paceibacterota bacterium]